MKLSLKITLNKTYIYCLSLWAFLSGLVSDTTLIDYMPWMGSIYNISWFIIRTSLVFIIIYVNRKSVKRILLSFILILLGIYTTKNATVTFMLPFFWFIAASNEIDVDEEVKVVFIAQLISTFIIISLAYMGIISDVVSRRSSDLIVRHSYGYENVNSFGGRLMSLALMSLYLRRNRLKIIDSIGIIMISVIIFIISNSRTSAYLLLLATFLVWLHLLSIRKLPLLSQMSESVINFLRYICMVLAIISFLLALVFPNINFVTHMKAGSTLYVRLSQMYLYLKAYHINIFGQDLYYKNDTTSSIFSGMITLDNGYLYLLLGFGILVFLLFLYLYVAALIDAFRRKEYIRLIVLAVYAISGFTETFILRFNYNYTLIFLFEVFWKRIIGERKSQI